jgi:hypothetical protein
LRNVVNPTSDDIVYLGVNLSVTRTALAFIEARNLLMADLGDFTHDPVLTLEASPLAATLRRSRR